MFDINTIVNAAIHDAVQEAMKGHITNTIVLAQRCTALERELDTLKQRVEALEAEPTNATPENISCDAFVVYLDNQEWFWEKLTSKAKEVADVAAEEAIEQHCSNYDHDDYDRTVSKVDELEDNSSMEQAIKDALSEASFDVRISF